ncbi:MAG: ribbon-helix-helix protein, CopG family [Spirochaetales bacterium]|nr:ribbon-helix-helix protein, CopG family [Spirochaetales bacterium]
MRTVTLKTDSIFFDRLTRLAKELRITKSEFIRRSVSEYEKYLYREKLKSNIQEASRKVREANIDIVEDFDTASNDGLENV